jgi:hypothetical protein
MLGDREGAADWLRRAAARYRESWDAGGGTDAWGRPIAAMKALLVAGDDAGEAAHWTLETCLGISYRDVSVSPIGRYASALALLVLGRDTEALEVAETLTGDFPEDVAGALRALAAHDAVAYRAAVESIRRSFEKREDFLEDIPVPDTALALEALWERRRLES